MVNGRSEWNYYCGTPKNKKREEVLCKKGECEEYEQ